MCCRLSMTTMPESEWTEQAEEILMLKGKQYVDTIRGVRRYVSEATCPHLDLITSKCMIQGHKPAWCKNYPVDDMDVLPGCGYR